MFVKLGEENSNTYKTGWTEKESWHACHLGRKIWSTDGQSAPSLVQMAQPFSSILLSQDSGCPGKGSSLKLRPTMKAWSLETACCPESLPMGPPSAYLRHSLSFNYQWPKLKSNWPEFLQQFLKKLGIKLPHDLTSPLLGIYPKKTTILKDTGTLMFTLALFSIAMTWKQPRFPSTDEWIKKPW